MCIEKGVGIRKDKKRRKKGNRGRWRFTHYIILLRTGHTVRGRGDDDDDDV